MKLAILICAHNEASTVADVVVRNRDAVSPLVESVEVYVVDDHSTDATVSAARGAGAQIVPVLDGSGLANAFSTGVDAALNSGATHLAHTDADAQYAHTSLIELCRLASAGADLIVGDRLWRHPPGMSDIRFLWNQRLTDMVGLLAGARIADSQSGCRVFSRAVAEEVKITSSFTYTQEQIIRAVRSGVHVEQVPVDFGPRQSGASRLVKSPLNYLARVFGDLDVLAKELHIDLENAAFLPSVTEQT